MSTTATLPENTGAAIKSETDAIARERDAIMRSLSVTVKAAPLDDSTQDGQTVRAIYEHLQSAHDLTLESYKLAESLTMPASMVREYLKQLAGDNADRALLASISTFCALYGVRRILTQQTIGSIGRIPDSRLRLLSNLYGTSGDSWSVNALTVKFDFPSLGVAPRTVTEQVIGEKDDSNAIVRYLAWAGRSASGDRLAQVRDMVRYVDLRRKQQSCNRQITAAKRTVYQDALSTM
jgi:hypothetical protein